MIGSDDSKRPSREIATLLRREAYQSSLHQYIPHSQEWLLDQNCLFVLIAQVEAEEDLTCQNRYFSKALSVCN